MKNELKIGRRCRRLGLAIGLTLCRRDGAGAVAALVGRLL